MNRSSFAMGRRLDLECATVIGLALPTILFAPTWIQMVWDLSSLLLLARLYWLLCHLDSVLVSLAASIAANTASIAANAASIAANTASIAALAPVPDDTPSEGPDSYAYDGILTDDIAYAVGTFLNYGEVWAARQACRHWRAAFEEVHSTKAKWDFPRKLWLKVASFLDIKSIFKVRQLSRSWKVYGDYILEEKKEEGAGVFASATMLTGAVVRFNALCEFYDAEHAEDFARRFGWFMSAWDVSRISRFSYLFQNKADFNEDISTWDMRSATHLDGMFLNAGSFNRDISHWFVGNVRTMRGMFRGARSFNCDISGWDTSSLLDMDQMFDSAVSFRQDLSSWNLSNVTSMVDYCVRTTSFRKSENLVRKAASLYWQSHAARARRVHHPGDILVADEGFFVLQNLSTQDSDDDGDE